MNRTLQDSIDAFRALGQQAPQQLQKVADAIQKQQKALQASPLTGATGSALGGLFSSLPGGGALSALATTGGTAALALGGGAVAGSFVAATHAALDYADSLVKLSDKTGVGTEALQKLESIGIASGNSLEELSGGINQFQKRLAGGDQNAADAISAIGESTARLKSLTPDQQFIAIAHGIQSIQDPATQTRLAIELFGKSGAELLPSLKANVDDLARATVVMSAESVAALDKAGDAWNKFLRDAKAAAGGVVAAIVEANDKQESELLRLQREVALKQGKVTFDIALAPPPKLPTSPLVVSTAAQAQADIDKQTGGASEQLRKAVAASDAILEQHLKHLKELGDELSGRKGLDGLKDLTTAWNALSPAEQANTLVIQRVVAAFEPLAAQLDPSTLPNDLSVLQLQFGKTADAIRKIEQVASGLPESLSNIGIKNSDVENLKQESKGLDELSASLAKFERQGVPTNFTQEGIEKIGVQIDIVKPKVKTLSEELTEVSQALSQLSTVSGGSFGGIVKGLAQVVTGANVAVKALEQIKTADSLLGEATGILSFGAGIFSIGENIIKSVQDALLKLERSRISSDVGRDLGVSISDGIAQGIQDSENSLSASVIQSLTNADIPEAVAKVLAQPKNFREAAIALNLPQIIQGAGGVEAFGIDKTIQKTHDLFSLLQEGKLTVAQVGKEFDDIFGQLIPTAISKTSGLASAQFTELAQTALRFGTQSPALNQFQSQQIGTVNTGLTSTLGVNSDATAKALDLQNQLNDAQAKGDSDEAKAIAQIIGLQSKLDSESNSDKRAAIQAQINDLLRRGATDYSNVVDLQKQLDQQQNLINATTIRSQAAATGFAGALLGSFAELQREGEPLGDIFKQIGPNIQALQGQLDKTGFTGGAAFDKLNQLAALASDQLAGPALDAVTGIQQALAGLSNTGNLDADTFSGLAAAVGDTFNNLVSEGKDGNQVLKLIAPSLQTIFELQERTGFAVDETTANLIAQAKAQGIVGDQFKSTGDQTVDALNKTNEILTAIAKALGATLPAAAQAGAAGVQNALDGIKAPQINIKVGVDTSGISNDFGIDTSGQVFQPIATGGIVTANGIQHFLGGGRVLPFVPRGTDTVPAMLTPGELVLNAAQQKNLANGLGGVSVGGISVNIHPPAGADGKQMADLFVQELRTNAVLYQAVSTVAIRSVA